ncbi:hypothetical protein HY450_03555 [Candidatus Pacearchaeota archaeon]|nr:hypothetical protein [Candidatus Pacearchaeota archaeon]
MGAKDFFKPNILKIVLTIVLITLFNLYAYWSWTKIMVDCATPPCPLPAQPDYLLLTLISLIPAYLISCLIGWIIEKIKSK